jgi:DDB1- and CUL4-associated factor 7
MEEPAGEIYEYTAPWMIYALSWSNRFHYRLALGSFLEEYNNIVEVVQLDQKTGSFQKIGQCTHPYPPTKLMWSPSSVQTELLASTSDYLRLWQLREDNTLKERHLLNNVSFHFFH